MNIDQAGRAGTQFALELLLARCIALDTRQPLDNPRAIGDSLVTLRSVEKQTDDPDVQDRFRTAARDTAHRVLGLAATMRTAGL